MRFGRALLAVLAFTLVSGCRTAPDDGVEARFEEAVEAFDSAKSREEFLLVATKFRALAESDWASGTVLYNLGNAYARAGQKGRAVAAYRQALRLRPRDEDIRNNLKETLGSAPTFGTGARSFFDHLFFWKGWLSVSEIGWLTGELATIAFLFAVAGVFLQHGLARILRNVFIVLTLVCGLSYWLGWLEQRPGRYGAVLADGAVARTGNSDTYAPAFTEPMGKATEFRVLEQRGEWIQIELPSGPKGWVEADDVEIY